MQLNILRGSVRWLNPAGYRINNQRFWTAIEFLSTGKQGTVELGGKYNISRWKERIYIYRSVDLEWQQSVNPEETVEIPGYGSIEVELKRRCDCILPPPQGVLYCDYRKLRPGPFTVRPATEGDKIIPYGMSGHRKVSDIFREADLPPHRRNYPVVTFKDRIVAIPALRIAEEFKLDSDTQQVVAFKLTLSRDKTYYKDT